MRGKGVNAVSLRDAEGVNAISLKGKGCWTDKNTRYPLAAQWLMDKS